MEPGARPDRRDVAAAAIGFARGLLRRAGPGLVVAFALLAASLWTFGELAEEVLEGEPFELDEPVLRAARAVSSPHADAVFLFLSAIGFAWGVVPVDIALVLVLAARRRVRDAVFAMLALGGSALLNVVAKQAFRRERPALWESVAPEATYSFPSGHAMGSATLACVVVLLCWHRRERAAVLVIAGLFVLGVGLSRVYLGVHYPSDIVAGWSAALAWTLAVHVAMRRREPPGPRA